MEDDSLSILNSVRIGAVPYLNAKPLVYGIEDKIIFKHPSSLSKDFFSGKLDVALIPIFTIFDQPEIVVADGISISSWGSVYSVILAYHGELEEVRKIYLDPASCTSTHLIKVMCRQFLKIEPEFSAQEAQEDGARLLIGDQAIRFRQEKNSQWKYLDLGETWMRFTDLPFVFAAWAIRKDADNPSAIAGALREIKGRGIQATGKIIEKLPLDQREFAKKYLTDYIHYNLGEKEKRGAQTFSNYLHEQNFLFRGENLIYI